MGEGSITIIEELKTNFRLWLARLAVKWCGIPAIYWVSPLEWEDYMSVGKPMTPEVYYQKEEND